MKKEDLRKAFKKKRLALSAAEVQRRSDAVCKRILEFSGFQKARTVMLYAAAFGEVDPAGLLEGLWRAGKTVCLPRCEENPRTLTALAYSSTDHLVADAYGILIPESGEVVLPERLDLVLIPGIAFDRSGGRIGFGAGYYDRFLNDIGAKKLGLAYDFQITETVAASSHDIAMDYIATESELIICG